MESLSGVARVLIGLGLTLVVVGVFIFLLGKISGVGRMPGDILVKKDNFTFFFPLGTCILISVVATVFMNILGRK